MGKYWCILHWKNMTLLECYYEYIVFPSLINGWFIDCFDATIIRYEISVFRHQELDPKFKTKISQVLVCLRLIRKWSVKTAIKIHD